MGALGEADRRHLDNGGTLDDAILFLFNGDSCEDCPLPISFNDFPTVDFILGSFGCDGFITDFGFLGDDVLKNDDMICVCVWVLRKKIYLNALLIGFVSYLKVARKYDC